MDDIKIRLERHEQKINILERDLSVMKDIQNEIRSMNEILVTLANELKHTNVHLDKHEKQLSEIDSIPKKRLHEIYSAILAAVVGGFVSYIITNVFK